MSTLIELVREFGDIIAALLALAGSVWASLRLRTDLTFNPTLKSNPERNAIRAISTSLCVVAIVAALSFSRFNPAGFPWVTVTVVMASLAMISTLTTLALRAVSIYPVEVGEVNGVPVVQNAIGGFTLTPFASERMSKAVKANVRWSPQSLLRGDVSKLDTVWTRGSRAMLYGILVASTVTMLGSTAATVCFSAGWLVAAGSPANDLRSSMKSLGQWSGKIGPPSVDVYRLKPDLIRLPSDSRAFPRDLTDARGRFEAAWFQAPGERTRLPAKELADALATLVATYRKQEASAANKHEATRWIDEAIGHFRLRDEWRPHLAQFYRLRALVLLDEVQGSALGSIVREAKLNDVFTTLNQWTALSGDGSADPTLLATYMRSFYERAKPSDITAPGVWKADMLQETVRYGDRVRQLSGLQDTAAFAELLAVYRRFFISDYREKGAPTVTERAKVLESATAIYSQVMNRGPSPSDYSFLVNFATTVHDYIFITTDPADQNVDVSASLERLRKSVIEPLRVARTLAETDGLSGLHGNIGDLFMDLARAHALEADLLGRFPDRGVQKDAALSNSVEFLRLVDTDDRVPNSSRRRLLSELASGRPEWENLKGVSAAQYLFRYSEAIVQRASHPAPPATVPADRS